MKISRWMTASVLVLAGAAFVPASAAPVGADGTLSLEGLVLQRDDLDTDRFLQDTSALPDVFFDEVNVDITGGARLMIEDDFGGHRWQFGGFFVVPADGQAVFTSPGEAFNADYSFFDNLPGTDQNSTIAFAGQVDYELQLWGGEINYVHNLSSWGWKSVDFLIGARYLGMDEELRTVLFDEADDFNGLDTGIDRVGVDISNNLVGLQVGFQALYDFGGSVHFGWDLKGGVGANFVSRDRTFLSDNTILNTRADTLDDTGFAQWVEFNPKLIFDISETAALTIGGTVLWVNGVSEATAHFSTAGLQPDGDVRDDGDILLYGGTIGLTLKLN